MARSRLARRLGLCLVLALLALVVALPDSAAASPPHPVTITVDTTIAPDAVDPFVATGGVVCETGTVSSPVTLFVAGVHPMRRSWSSSTLCAPTVPSTCCCA
jgi:hypothetical protein